MPLDVGDYLADTGHLTTTQHGAYLLLIMHYWRTGGLPNDDKQLAKITRMPAKFWAEYRPVLQDMFCTVGDDPWRHKRIDAEMEKARSISEKRKQAGAIGGTCAAIARSSVSGKSPRAFRPVGTPSASATQQMLGNREQLLENSKQMSSKAIDNNNNNISKSKSENSVKAETGGSLATALLSSARREPPNDRPASVPPSAATRADLEAAFARRRGEVA